MPLADLKFALNPKYMRGLGRPAIPVDAVDAGCRAGLDST